MVLEGEEEQDETSVFCYHTQNNSGDISYVILKYNNSRTKKKLLIFKIDI